MRLRSASSILVAAALACGGIDMSGSGPSGSPSGSPPPADGGAAPAPIIAVVSPPAGHEIEFQDEDDDHHGEDRVEIEVDVQGATLRDPGKCGSATPCGHLVLTIDGNGCGTPNAQSSERHFPGVFGKCKKVSGKHELVVHLVDDRGNVLASSAPVTVEVRLKKGHG